MTSDPLLVAMENDGLIASGKPSYAELEFQLAALKAEADSLRSKVTHAEWRELNTEALLVSYKDDREKYNELILAVGRIYPNETRHESALRYLREREASFTATASLQKGTSGAMTVKEKTS